MDQIENLVKFITAMNRLFDVEKILIYENGLTHIDFIAFFMGQYAVNNVDVYQNVIITFNKLLSQKELSNTVNIIHNNKTVQGAVGGFKSKKNRIINKIGAGTEEQFKNSIKNSIKKIKDLFKAKKSVPLNWKPDEFFIKGMMKSQLITDLNYLHINRIKEVKFGRTEEIENFLIELENSYFTNANTKILEYLEELKGRVELLLVFTMDSIRDYIIYYISDITNSRILHNMFLYYKETFECPAYNKNWIELVELYLFKEQDHSKNEKMDIDEDIMLFFKDSIEKMYTDLKNIINTYNVQPKIKNPESFYTTVIDYIIPSINNSNIVTITNSFIPAYNHFVKYGYKNGELPDAIRFIMDSYIPQSVFDFKKEFSILLSKCNYKDNNFQILKTYFNEDSITLSTENINTCPTITSVMLEIIIKCEIIGCDFSQAIVYLKTNKLYVFSDSLLDVELNKRELNNYISRINNLIVYVSDYSSGENILDVVTEATEEVNEVELLANLDINDLYLHKNDLYNMMFLKQEEINTLKINKINYILILLEYYIKILIICKVSIKNIIIERENLLISIRETFDNKNSLDTKQIENQKKVDLQFYNYAKHDDDYKRNMIKKMGLVVFYCMYKIGYIKIDDYKISENTGKMKIPFEYYNSHLFDEKDSESFSEDTEHTEDAGNTERLISSVYENLITRYEKSTSGITNGGAKLIKNYMDKLYVCNDNIKRRAFRIKGKNNSIYVMYKKRVTKACEIPKSKKKSK